MSPSTKVAGNCVNARPGSPQLLLLDQLGDRIRFKHYSMRTEPAYSLDAALRPLPQQAAPA